jgi:hypothetical protein
MLLKVQKIIEIKPYFIVCEFNNGVKKKLEILPLIENHAHLSGIEQLENLEIFSKASIGAMGEIFWAKIIKSKSNEVWDYDISPEYIFYNGSSMEQFTPISPSTPELS